MTNITISMLYWTEWTSGYCLIYNPTILDSNLAFLWVQALLGP